MSGFAHTMRLKDLAAFRDAAKVYKCWILVRAINPASLSYLDHPAYTPKPIDCKPKTADADIAGKKLAGLVVVPTLFGLGAFKGDQFVDALKAWKEFRESHKVAEALRGSEHERARQEAKSLNEKHGEYAVDLDEHSHHFGCLQFHGKWIHGDFDLKDIVLEGQGCRNLGAVEQLRGQPHMRGPRYFKIRDFINARLGKPLIQHSGEAQFADHSTDLIDVFGPKGQHNQLRSVAEIVAWYDRHNREVIITKDKPPPTAAEQQREAEQRRAKFRVIPGGAS